jgi:uncharacterized membrane protein HdeD (DUF308 family)
MLIIHQIALYTHIAVGACALIIFWIPVFTRKGNLDHKRFGRYFASAMYLVSFSGLTMSSLDLLFPIEMHAVGIEFTSAELEAAKSEVREFALFLFSLSVLVLTSTRQGWLVILHKADRSPLRTVHHTALCASLSIVGLVLFFVGAQSQNYLFMIFAVLQIVSGVNSLRYNYKAQLQPKQWWTEHLSGLIGSGIGAYTAFFVFGGRQIFDSLFGQAFSNSAIVLWIAPGIVGSIAISWLSRHYKVKFNTDWALKRAQTRSALVK